MTDVSPERKRPRTVIAGGVLARVVFPRTERPSRAQPCALRLRGANIGVGLGQDGWRTGPRGPFSISSYLTFGLCRAARRRSFHPSIATA